MNQKSTFPSGPIGPIKGECIYLQGNDIDTDRIIPARFLKCISFDDLGKNVFADDRNEKNGLHPFDQEHNQNGSILLVNKNFGCGSSREHAPQALMRWGIRSIIGQSFAEIFYGNCLSIGIPCATISESDSHSLTQEIESSSGIQLNLDLKSQTLSSKERTWPIKIESDSLNMLLSGRWDATSTLLKEQEKIKNTKARLPYLNNFNEVVN